MKKSSYTATHSGECQLCGHIQKLPGGGLLSLHGYEVRWNSFQGTCPGSRNQPYEKAYNLLGAEIERQRHQIANLKAWVKEIAAPSFKNVFVQEYISATAYGYAKGRSSYAERELKPSEYTATKGRIEWMSLERGKDKSEKKEISNYGSASAAEMIAYANKRKIDSIKANIKTREQYCEWLQDRITKWTLRDLTPLAAEEIGTKGPSLHALNAYYSKKTGRDEALCGGGSHSMRGYTYKQIAKDNAKVTCKACLKALAATAADAALTVQADALVAEMVTKFGPTVLQQFSDASDKAIKEIRYQRKDLDKELRAKAIRIIERGVRS